MTQGPLPSFTWHELGKPPPQPEALVLHLCMPGELPMARRRAQAWQAIVPRCAFAALNMTGGATPAPHSKLHTLIRRHTVHLGLHEGQLVVIAEGRAALWALGLVARPSALNPHAVLADLPCVDMPQPPGGRQNATCSLRFVQHRLPEDPENRRFHHTVNALRRVGFDIRTILLPDGAGPHARAIAAFLVELVAIACRSPATPDPEQSA
ncbi:hypothetical protein [Novosphingobium terrae]|uniref:hypothetical protein n=1 Tax=Novosphingobium terrae TaxID=2726189 RepID=UPI0019811FD4|nr:hypothetical protein [Novosphingobium terrae]